ncbi:MAG: NAD+ synthase [Nitrospirae bacterium]|nr:NAD+ synthase [Nitrospirota bacterium]
MKSLRLGLSQFNSTVGDNKGNAKKICLEIEKAKKLGVDLIAFPELAITGYPPEDLLLKPSFISENQLALEEIVKGSAGIGVIVGFVDRQEDIYNAAAFISNGKIQGIYHKIYLPNYGVFDEERYFRSGSAYPIFVFNGVLIGINICEDIWYPYGPAMVQSVEGNAELIINISASPYHAGKGLFREKMLATRAVDNNVMIAYVNAVGGQDELVFDGQSAIIDQKGDILVRGPAFDEKALVVDLAIDSVFRSRLHDPRRRRREFFIKETSLARLQPVIQAGKSAVQKRKKITPVHEQPLSQLEEIYKALVTGVRDYVLKNHFSKTVIGLSGGIDSALTLLIAVDALGKKNVTGVFMPSPFTSKESKEDVDALVKNTGVDLITLPITEIFESYLKILKKEWGELKPDKTEENIQARIRGNFLMGLSNKFGWLVLTTGNKSEMSVGYATLYGDMAGGFSVIKDVLKTEVYALSDYRNIREGKELIPRRIFEKPPSAELKFNQTDQDTLPPYDILDGIIRGYVEEDQSIEELTAQGYSRSTVEYVMKLVEQSEYKRRQSPPGVKITQRGLGKDRRMPITNQYKSF